jgi:hypothetical protein
VKNAEILRQRSDTLYIAVATGHSIRLATIAATSVVLNNRSKL